MDIIKDIFQITLYRKVLKILLFVLVFNFGLKMMGNMIDNSIEGLQDKYRLEQVYQKYK